MLSVIVKPWIAREKAEKAIARLNEAIAEAERQQNRSLLDGLSGVERFNAAAALLEATLLVRAGTRGAVAERAALISRYLQRLQEEYEMSRNDLKQVPASRAEVVALGLALKEVALSLDGELASFRGTSGTAVQALNAARDDALARVDAAAAELSSRMQAAHAAQDRRLEGMHAALRSSVEEQRDALRTTAGEIRGEVSAASVELRGQIISHHALHQRQLDEIRGTQDALRIEFSAMEARLRMWIYAVLALAVIAFITAVAI